MACNCPKTYERNGQNAFEHMCGTEVFKTYHSVWDTRINDYLDYINNIKEPILKYISIYYVQYYIDGYDYYHKSENSQRSAACTYIKRWLRKQKDIFTYGEKCEARKQLWENNFSTLWNKLQSKYVVPEYKNKTKPWCDNHPLTFKTEFSEEVTLPPYCDESIPQETISTNCPLLPVKEECDCSQSVVHEILSPPDQAPAADRTKNLAVTSGFTAAGTLGTLFFLYRFTPMMSWFRRPGMNHVGTDLYMNSGGADAFLRMQHDDGGNNLFYQP